MNLSPFQTSRKPCSEMHTLSSGNSVVHAKSLNLGCRSVASKTGALYAFHEIVGVRSRRTFDLTYLVCMMEAWSRSGLGRVAGMKPSAMKPSIIRELKSIKNGHGSLTLQRNDFVFFGYNGRLGCSRRPCRATTGGCTKSGVSACYFRCLSLQNKPNDTYRSAVTWMRCHVPLLDLLVTRRLLSHCRGTPNQAILSQAEAARGDTSML